MKSVPFLRDSFNYDRDAASDDSSLSVFDDSLTHQSFADECDINTIMRRFGVTGQLPEAVRAPTYDDFTNVVDYHTACNAIAVAGEAFDQMPAEVRARFNNDPQKFLEFCSNEDNRPEAIKLGLVVPAVASLASQSMSASAPVPGDPGAPGGALNPSLGTQA